MPIKTITVHRVEVEVPERVWTLYGESTTYEKMMLAAVEGAIESGNERYGKIYEYAEYSTLGSASAAEARMNLVVLHFTQMQTEYDKEVG
jgi:pyruvoyl-dependent arginine decarboxylase (PvlArgDC)